MKITVNNLTTCFPLDASVEARDENIVIGENHGAPLHIHAVNPVIASFLGQLIEDSMDEDDAEIVMSIESNAGYGTRSD